MSLYLAIFGWIFTILAGVIVGLIVYSRWHYGSLERLGIPVVKPYLFLGSNYNEPYVDITKQDIQRQKEYGLVYGVYDGRSPQIYIADPKIIRLISTVDFEHFQNHGWVVGSDSLSILTNILDFLNDEKWKTVRGALTPIFTGGKIKQLSPTIQSFCENYAEDLANQCDLSGGRVNGLVFKEFIAPMIIEVLGKCFCGIDIPNAKDPNSAFIQNMKQPLFHDIPQEDWKTVVAKVFPLLTYILPTFPADGLDFFVDTLCNIIETREKSGEVSIDATHTMVDMMKKVRTDSKYKSLGINRNVVLAQGWEFFAAGYSTIRDIFIFFMYEMAMNEDIQQQIYEEICSNTIEGQKVTLETISRLPYLGACLLETLRLHPSFLRPERICNKDWKGEGLSIRKGTQVIFPIANIHHNPKFYPNPEIFYPNRFMTVGKDETRDPYTFMTFGQGPRNCIGQRFGIEMLKIMLVSFLLRFKILKREDTVCEPKIGGTFILSFEPVLVDIVKR